VSTVNGRTVKRLSLDRKLGAHHVMALAIRAAERAKARVAARAFAGDRVRARCTGLR
jgi:hypothetical protein